MISVFVLKDGSIMIGERENEDSFNFDNVLSIQLGRGAEGVYPVYVPIGAPFVNTPVSITFDSNEIRFFLNKDNCEKLEALCKDYENNLLQMYGKIIVPQTNISHIKF